MTVGEEGRERGHSAESGQAKTVTREMIPPIGAGRKAVSPAGGGRREIAPVTLMGSVATASPANSFALSGNYAYVCDNNEITVVNIANPANLQIVGTATSPVIQNSEAIHCAIERGTLSVFADQGSTGGGNSPSFLAFGLSNPAIPQLIQATSINRRFFGKPAYEGNYAYVPLSALTFFFGWDHQLGDLISVDLTNFAAPVVRGILQTPVPPHEIYGGETAVLGATAAGSKLVYIGGSTSELNLNTGKGRLQIVDVTNPAAMKVVGQRAIPGSVHLNAPLVNGNIAVGVGNNGGYVGANGANPVAKGQIVVAIFDVADRRSPEVLSIQTTAYKVGPGGGATRIGTNLYAFGGVQDASSNNVLLVVDVSNPLSPQFDHLAIPQPSTSLEAVGTRLYATQGAGGFAVYSIPGIGPAPVTSCPLYRDAMLVMDCGAAIPEQAFADAKAALTAFVDNFRLPTDKVGVASFTTQATLHQPLTGNSGAAKAAFNAIFAGGGSYIGAGIAAAQAELKGANMTSGAEPVMVIVSDGADGGAPDATATVAAANAAKAAGIKIISIQYGSTASPLMQSIASSTGDFHLVSP